MFNFITQQLALHREVRAQQTVQLKTKVVKKEKPKKEKSIKVYFKL